MTVVPTTHLQVIGSVPQLRSPIIRRNLNEFTEDLWLDNYNALLLGKTKENIYPVYRSGIVKVKVYPALAQQIRAKIRSKYDIYTINKNYEQ